MVMVFTHKVTLQETQSAMEELVSNGKTPNGKLAFWNACLSTRNKLDRNCKQALVMRQYVNRPLPVNRDELRVELGGLLNRTLNALYEIERLWNCGLIHFNTGDTFELQAKWRDCMAALIPGMGMKTISFSLHIYNPSGCKLITIDCWHLRRLQVTDDSPTRKQYLQYEQEIISDCAWLADAEGNGKKYWLITYAACLWERTRQAHGVSDCKDGEYQDHSGLSCYV